MANNEYIVKNYEELSKKTTEVLDSIREVIKQMNDQNALHTEVLQAHGKLIEDNTYATRGMKEYWGKIVLILIASLAIIAAGKEVILPVINKYF